MPDATLNRPSAALATRAKPPNAPFPPLSYPKNRIKVALVDTTLDDTSQVITAIATDNTAGGAAAADALAKLIGEKGEVMVIAFQAGASTSDGPNILPEQFAARPRSSLSNAQAE